MSYGAQFIGEAVGTILLVLAALGWQFGGLALDWLTE